MTGFFKKIIQLTFLLGLAFGSSVFAATSVFRMVFVQGAEEPVKKELSEKEYKIVVDKLLEMTGFSGREDLRSNKFEDLLNKVALEHASQNDRFTKVEKLNDLLSWVIDKEFYSEDKPLEPQEVELLKRYYNSTEFFQRHLSASYLLDLLFNDSVGNSQDNFLLRSVLCEALSDVKQGVPVGRGCFRFDQVIELLNGSFLGSKSKHTYCIQIAQEEYDNNRARRDVSLVLVLTCASGYLCSKLCNRFFVRPKPTEGLKKA